MYSCPTKSAYSTPSCHRCQSHQARPYHIDYRPSDNERLSSNDQDTSAQGVKYQRSPYRPIPNVSLDIFSLIRKFEALGPLDLPFKISNLQSAPSKTSQTSPRGKAEETGTSQPSRPLISFSPRSWGGSRFKDVLSDDKPTSAQEDSFYPPSSTYGKRIRKSDSETLGQVQSPYKASSIQFESAAPDCKPPSLLKEHMLAPHSRKGRAVDRRGSTVNDKVRLFDGSLDNTIASCKLRVQVWGLADIVHFLASSFVSARERLSSDAPYPTSPPFGERNNDMLPLSIPSTIRGADPKISPTKSDSPLSPGKRHFVVGDSTPNPFLIQNPHSKSPLQRTLQRTSPKTERDLRYLATECKSCRECSLRHNAVTRIPEPEEEDTSPDDSKDISLIRASSEPRSTMTEQTRIGDKIEALYRARNSEKKKGYSWEVSRGRNMVRPSNTRLMRDIFEPVGTTRKVDGTNLPTGESIVSNKRMAFDGGQITKQSGPQDCPSSSRASRTTALAIRKEKMFTGFPPPPPPPAPPLPQHCILGISGASAKEHGIIAPQIPDATGEGEVSLPNSTPKRSRTVSKAIEDKMRFFEETPETTAVIDTNLRGSSDSKRAGNSMFEIRKRLFEDIGRERHTTDGLGKRLSIGDINDIINEFQVVEGDNLGKRNGVVGKWNLMAEPSSISNRMPVELKGPVAVGGASRDAIREMVIKEAECGLKEPKPLRLAEMKRMMWMCTEKVDSTRMRRKAVSKSPKGKL